MNTQLSGAAQIMCPVLNVPVDFQVKVEGEDGPVYFCCEHCAEHYAANPKKYASTATIP